MPTVNIRPFKCLLSRGNFKIFSKKKVSVESLTTTTEHQSQSEENGIFIRQVRSMTRPEFLPKKIHIVLEANAMKQEN